MPKPPEPTTVESVPATMAPFMWAIRDDERITGMTFTVASLHASIADVSSGGNVFASQQNMATKLGLSDRGTIGKHQRILRALGYLQAAGRRGQSKVHRLSLPMNSPYIRYLTSSGLKP